MSSLFADVRHGWRALRRAPGYTAVALLMISLSVGANTALFTVIDAVLLRPLPYAEPDRVVALWETALGADGRRSRVTAADYRDVRDQSTVFEATAMFGAAGFNLTAAGEPEQVLGSRVTASYFETLGVQPMLGRAFVAEEEQPGSRVAILGHGLWQRRFGGRRDVVGASIVLDDQLHIVVGVMPAGVYPTWPATQAFIPFLPRYQQIWVPIGLTPERSADRRSHVYGALARLRDGVALDEAQAQMDAIAIGLADQYPDAKRDEGIAVVPLTAEMVGSVRRTLLTLFGAVGVLLLVACANVAGLGLARALSRRHETAIRVALGATRWRLVRRLLVETVLLALIGGTIGLALAWMGIGGLVAVAPQDIPRLDAANIHGGVVAFTLFASAVAGLLCGILPALATARRDVQPMLQSGARVDRSGIGGDGIRRGLVVAEIGAAVVLVIGAGLLIRSFNNLQDVDVGFTRERVLTMDLVLPPTRYPQAAHILTFHRELRDRLEGLPGVVSMATAYNHPLDATWIDGFVLADRPEPEPGEQPTSWMRPVSHDYFVTAGVQILRGRAITETDDLNHPGAVVINESFARRFYPDEDPLGKRLRLQSSWVWPTPTDHEIVGIARDVKFLGPEREAEAAYYRSFRQFPLHDMTILVRAAGDPLALARAVRAEVWEVDPDQPIANVSTMAQHYDAAVAQPRFGMWLLTLFGGLTLALAVIGVYGLVTYLVTQRTKEIGIRMALGAAAHDVAALFLGIGLRLSLAGALVGLIGALALSRFLQALLFEVSSADPLTYAVMTGALTAAALLACYLPARRATRIDPATTLRTD